MPRLRFLDRKRRNVVTMSNIIMYILNLLFTVFLILPVYLVEGKFSDLRFLFFSAAGIYIIIILINKYFRSKVQYGFPTYFSIIYALLITTLDLNYPRSYYIPYYDSFVILVFIVYVISVLSFRSLRNRDNLVILTLLIFGSFPLFSTAHGYVITSLIYASLFILKEFSSYSSSSKNVTQATSYSLILYIIVFSLLVTVFLSPAPVDSAKYAMQFSLMILMMFFSGKLIDTNRDTEFFRYILLSGIINVFYVIIGFFYNDPLSGTAAHSIFIKSMDIAGINTGILGSYFILLIPVVAIFTLLQMRYRKMIFGAVILILFLISTIATWSRTALPMPFISIFLLFLFLRTNKIKDLFPVQSFRSHSILLKVFVISSLPIVFYIIIMFFTASKLNSLENFAIRSFIWNLALSHIKEHFWFGYGDLILTYIFQKQYILTSDPYLNARTIDFINELWPQHVHNILLQPLMQFGLFVFLTIIYFFTLPFFRSVRSFFITDKGYYRDMIAIGFLLGLLSFLLHGLMHYSLSMQTTGITFFSILGGMSAYYNNGNPKKESQFFRLIFQHLPESYHRLKIIILSVPVVALLLFTGYHLQAVYNRHVVYRVLFPLFYNNDTLRRLQLFPTHISLNERPDEMSIQYFRINQKFIFNQLNSLHDTYPEDSQTRLLLADSYLYKYYADGSSDSLMKAYHYYTMCSEQDDLPSMCYYRLSDLEKFLAPDLKLIHEFHQYLADIHDPFRMVIKTKKLKLIQDEH